LLNWGKQTTHVFWTVWHDVAYYCRFYFKIILRKLSVAISSNLSFTSLAKTHKATEITTTTNPVIINILIGIEQVLSAKLLGNLADNTCSNLTFDDHVKNVLTICSQRCYLLRCLKVQGLPAKELNIVFCAIVMSRILYALPAWGRFLTYELTSKIESFLRKAVRWGFSSHYKCLTDLLREADLHLFRKMTSISYFLPQQFCPWSLETLTVYLPYSSVIITCTNILLFLEICLFLLIGWMFGDIVFFYFFYFDSLLMLCYDFNLLMKQHKHYQIFKADFSHSYIIMKRAVLTCRYSQPATSANRLGMYEYISHSLASIFTLKPLQPTSPVHCMAHWATSGKPPTPDRLTTLLGLSTAHVNFSPGIARTGMNVFGDWPGHASQ